MRRASRGGFDVGALIRVKSRFITFPPLHPSFVHCTHDPQPCIRLSSVRLCLIDNHTLLLWPYTRIHLLAALPITPLLTTYYRCPIDTSLQLRWMIGLGCTAFLIAGTLLAMDLKFGWSRKKGGGRLKPIINAIQSLTVLIMFPSKVKRGYEERAPPPLQ